MSRAQPIGALSTITDAAGTPVSATVVASVKVTAIDRNGFVIVPDAADAITVTDLPKVSADDGDFYAMRTAIKRQLRIVITQQADADDGHQRSDRQSRYRDTGHRDY